MCPLSERGESHDGQDAESSRKLCRGTDATLGPRQILLQDQGVQSLQADGELHRLEHLSEHLTWLLEFSKLPFQSKILNILSIYVKELLILDIFIFLAI